MNFMANNVWGVKSFLSVVKLHLTSEGKILEGEFAVVMYTKEDTKSKHHMFFAYMK